MRRAPLLALSLSATALAFVACSDDDNGQTSSNTDQLGGQDFCCPGPVPCN